MADNIKKSFNENQVDGNMIVVLGDNNQVTFDDKKLKEAVETIIKREFAANSQSRKVNAEVECKRKEQAERKIKADFEIEKGVLKKYKGSDTEVIIPNGVTSIGNSAFSWCKELTKITIPNSVTSIGSLAFSSCSGLTSITIPDSVTSIDSSAFWACDGLTSIKVAKGNSVYHSVGNCIIETKTKKLVLGCKNSVIPTDGSVTSIDSAFYGCKGLVNITIPNSVISISSFAFEECKELTSITVEKGNLVYHSVGNCLIETRTQTLICGCKNSVIPTDGSVTSIGESAFNGCSVLKRITIPDSITSIGKEAFSGCKKLKKITIPNRVRRIDERAFYGCSALKRITIPDSITSIGNSAFSWCRELKKITIPNRVRSIGDSAFSWCEELTKIVIPDSVKSIGEVAFNNCDKLKCVKISKACTIAENSFPKTCKVKRRWFKSRT